MSTTAGLDSLLAALDEPDPQLWAQLELLIAVIGRLDGLAAWPALLPTPDSPVWERRYSSPSDAEPPAGGVWQLLGEVPEGGGVASWERPVLLYNPAARAYLCAATDDATGAGWW
mgnify:CR=1 FL=1